MISDHDTLSVPSCGVFIALDDNQLQPYLVFPTTLTETAWGEWVGRVAPDNPSEYLSLGAVRCDCDLRVFFDPYQQWYIAGRYIAGLAVLEAGQNRFTVLDSLSDLMFELDPASYKNLEPEVLSTWVGFWQVLGYDGGDSLIPRPDQPFWITQAYDGDHVALTPPSRLTQIVTAMTDQQVLDLVIPILSESGFDNYEADLQGLLNFMEQTGNSGQWLLGLEAAT